MYPRPIEAIYYWVLLLFGHEFKNALIKKQDGIFAKP